MTEPALDVRQESAKSLLDEVRERSEQNLTACYQCRRCAGACSVGDETDYFTPDRLIRTIITGDRTNALDNELIWKCVSCYTCGIRCPNNIQTGRITETLKKMSKEAHIKPRHIRVANFHNAFVKSGLRWGRVNETEFMGIYEMKNSLSHMKTMNVKAISNEIANQMKLGLALLKKKRMHFKFLSAKGRGEVKRLYKQKKKDKAR